VKIFGGGVFREQKATLCFTGQDRVARLGEPRGHERFDVKMGVGRKGIPEVVGGGVGVGIFFEVVGEAGEEIGFAHETQEHEHEVGAFGVDDGGVEEGSDFGGVVDGAFDGLDAG
jgi:hypothetical protein